MQTDPEGTGSIAGETPLHKIQEKAGNMITFKRRHEEKMRRDAAVRMLTEKELDQVHRVYLQMMQKIVSVCMSNGITVTLSGGSALGAIRHHGFIPWDDDMDMNIPRKDFESLKENFDDLFGGEYLLSSPNYHRRSGYRLARIENPAVRVCDEDGKTHGLRIDLFIIENMPDSRINRFFRGIRSEAIRIISGMVMEYERMSDHGQSRSMSDRLIGFGGKIFSFRKSDRWFDLVDKVNKWDDEKSRYVGIPSGRKHYFGEVFPREWMVRTVPVLFEGVEVPVPEGYGPYLRRLYGDYMTIPPEEDREHHFIRSISFD